ncbi:MAG TPA: hypothetical protein VI341_04570 [Actinomycetota bacterium]
MKLDERDEALGAMLDRSFERADRPAAPEPTSVMRRGTRRRAMVLIASLTVVAVFVGAIGFAASQFGSSNPPEPADGSTYRGVPFENRALGFSVSYPRGWVVADESLTPGLAEPRELFSVGTFPLRPGGRAVTEPYLPGNALDDLDPDDVFVTLQEVEDARWLNSEPRPATFDPSEPGSWCGSDRDCAEGLATRFLDREGVRSWWIPFQDAGRGFVAFVAMGEQASSDPELTGATWGMLDSFRFESGRPFADPVRFDPVDGWENGGAAAVNTTDLNIATTTNWGSGDSDDPFQAALEVLPTMGEEGVVIVAWQVGDETPGPNDPNFEPMSLPLALPTEVESSWEDGVEGKGRSVIVANVNGRAVQVWIFYGTPDPSDDVRTDAAAALARLQVEPLDTGDEPADLPPPTREEYRSEFVSDERGYRFWPISAPIEPGVVYRYAVPHCGLSWLVDIDGSFWEGRSIIFANDWVANEEIPDGDVGTIELNRGALRYGSPDGTWTQLSRVDGPIVRQLCR